MFAHLHTRSWFSFLAGSSSPETLVQAAADRGVQAVALTDVNGVYGVVRFQKACRAHGIKPLFGAEVMVDEHRLVLVARNEEGFSNLNQLLTVAHQRSREAPSVTFTELVDHAVGMHCLTGTREGRLWSLVDDRNTESAVRWLHQLHAVFGPRLSVEVATHLHPGDRLRVDRLLRLAERCYIPVVITGDVRYAQVGDYRRYDLMSCVRLGITVFDAHPERPRNAEAWLRSEEQLRKLIPCPAGFDRAAAIAQDCTLDLIPGYITPPAAAVPPPHTPRSYLHQRCWEGFARRYGSAGDGEQDARPPNRARARQDARPDMVAGSLVRETPPDPAGAVVVVRPDAPRSKEELRRRASEQLRKELTVIAQLDLDEFFLVVHEIVEEARRRGIRCAGRGSAANSIVAYLLGITGVDPVENRLLFERFLHAGRRGTPDIDVDFDSERRSEIITWMEDRFGMEQTAMTATLITYRARSALRDTAKALGWPPEIVNRMSKAIPPHWGSHKDMTEYRVRLERIVGPSPLLQVLLERASDLQGAPRHLGLHSGGMILSRKPLWHFSPVQVSANGVKVVQFDKDDVEALGLVKFDVLGLRMLACLSEAVELGERHGCFASGTPGASVDGVFDIDELTLDDPATYNLMRSSKTLGVFQIESQGQLHLLAQHQPEDFVDIINEIALFRPGPLQSGMVHPFVQRRRGLKPVEYPHPSLEPILRDTYGVIVYQEQVLEVAHHFAHMTLEEADEFRRLMSKFRDPGEMEGMRARFVSGAVAHGVDHATATAVFENVANFVGYGFCRSHAAAFAKTVYQSAYMKTHHAAAFMAAFLQHRPGMYNLMTLEEECRRFGVGILLPDINRSGVRYDLERVEDASPAGRRRGGAGRLAIRKPLTAIQGISEDNARAIAWERLNGPFRTVQDLYERVALDVDLFENVARSGALDALAGDSRRALWEIGLLSRRLKAGSRPSLLFDIPAFTGEDVPDLPRMTDEVRFGWDYQTHGAARAHPMTLVRRTLNDYEIRPISTCWGLGRAVSASRGTPDAPSRDGPIVTIAGIAMMRQRPGTANGVLFLTLEDETGFIQCFVYPKVLEALDHVLSQASLIVRGKLQVMGNWRGLVMHHAWPLNGILGGYEGHPSMAGGRDRMVKEVVGTTTSSTHRESLPSS